MVMLRDFYAKELAAIRAIEAETGEPNRGVNLLWWGVACLAGGAFWVAVLLAVF